MRETQRKTIEGWIDKASNQLQAAQEHAKSYHCSEAVQAAQECIELSVKSVLSLLRVDYPPAHEWAPEKKPFALIARQISERRLLEKLAGQYLNHIVPLPRLLLLMNFWGQFYLAAKYGFEAEQLASAQDLFRLEDAKLAVQHAEECHRAASTLLYHDKDKFAALLGETLADQQVDGPDKPL
jgi:HEPN domain-containing protein